MYYKILPEQNIRIELRVLKLSRFDRFFLSRFPVSFVLDCRWFRMVALPSPRQIDQAIIRILQAASILALLGISAPAYSQAILFHMQGEQGGREAFFSSTLVSDRTPPDRMLGPIEVKELDVTVIYEDPNQPEWAAMRLQFECTVKYAYDGKKIPKAPGWDAPVKVRLGEGSTILRRIDLQTEAVPSGQWQVAESDVMLKAHKLACNGIEIERAIQASIRGNAFDTASFNREVSGFGLTNGLTVLVNGTAPELLDLTWARLWTGSTRPDPSGKWSQTATPASKAEAERKMALVQQELAEMSKRIKSTYEPKVREAQGKFAFDEAAAKLRGGRKPRGVEAQLLMVWQAKPEEDVVAKMGRPNISDSGNLRILSYGQQYDNRVMVGSSNGATWVEGRYMSCDVEFITIPDSNGVRRVADVRISVDSNATGWGGASTGEACGELLQAPGN